MQERYQIRTKHVAFVQWYKEFITFLSLCWIRQASCYSHSSWMIYKGNIASLWDSPWRDIFHWGCHFLENLGADYDHFLNASTFTNSFSWSIRRGRRRIKRIFTPYVKFSTWKPPANRIWGFLQHFHLLFFFSQEICSTAVLAAREILRIYIVK